MSIESWEISHKTNWTPHPQDTGSNNKNNPIISKYINFHT